MALPTFHKVSDLVSADNVTSASNALTNALNNAGNALRTSSKDLATTIDDARAAQAMSQLAGITNRDDYLRALGSMDLSGLSSKTIERLMQRPDTLYNQELANKRLGIEESRNNILQQTANETARHNKESERLSANTEQRLLDESKARIKREDAEAERTQLDWQSKRNLEDVDARLAQALENGGIGAAEDLVPQLLKQYGGDPATRKWIMEFVTKEKLNLNPALYDNTNYENELAKAILGDSITNPANGKTADQIQNGIFNLDALIKNFASQGITVDVDEKGNLKHTEISDVIKEIQGRFPGMTGAAADRLGQGVSQLYNHLKKTTGASDEIILGYIRAAHVADDGYIWNTYAQDKIGAEQYIKANLSDLQRMEKEAKTAIEYRKQLIGQRDLLLNAETTYKEEQARLAAAQRSGADSASVARWRQATARKLLGSLAPEGGLGKVTKILKDATTFTKNTQFTYEKWSQNRIKNSNKEPATNAGKAYERILKASGADEFNNQDEYLFGDYGGMMGDYSSNPRRIQ